MTILPLQVVAITNQYPPYLNTGAQACLHDLLIPLQRRGHNVAVHVTDQTGVIQPPYDHEGIQVHTHREDRFVENAVQNSNLVICQMRATKLGVELGRKHRVPIVQAIYGDDQKSRERSVLGGELAVFCAEWLVGRFPSWTAEKISVHPVIRPEVYSTTRGSHVTLINLSALKGVYLFYELVDRMKDIQFLGVVGGHEEQIVRSYPNLSIVDNTSNVTRDVYARTKLVVMPSRHESYGRVAVEAMASGIPTIASPTPGLREALGPQGIYVESNDIHGWIERVRALLAPNNYSKASRMASRRLAEVVKQRDAETQRWIDTVERFGYRRTFRG